MLCGSTGNGWLQSSFTKMCLLSANKQKSTLTVSSDEMNAHVAQSIESRTELEQLASVHLQIISPRHSKPIIGIVQDTLLGINRITRPDINFSLKQLLNFCFGVKNFNGILPELKDKYNSKELVSMLLPENINITMDNKSDEKVKIQNGELKQGQLDKGIFSAGSTGLVHVLFNDYGPEVTADFLDDVQYIVNRYLLETGFSVGISDLVADQDTLEKIDEDLDGYKTEVAKFIKHLHLDVFENLTNHTNKMQFELQINGLLGKALSSVGKIGLKNLDNANRMTNMIKAGSKGSNLNIAQMIACLGQIGVDGKRVPYGFNNRTLPHFHKFDDSPQSRGFVEHSFMHGLDPHEFFFHAMGGREGLIDTAVKSVTADTKLVIMENSVPMNITIGDWVNNYLDAKENKKHIKYHGAEDANMELLDVSQIGKDVYIPTTDAKGNMSWEQVTNITRHDPSEILYKVTTKSGRSVKVVASKSMLVWNEKSQSYEPKDAEKVTVGDRVPISTHLQPNATIETYNGIQLDAKYALQFGKDLEDLEFIPAEFQFASKEFVKQIIVAIFANKENIIVMADKIIAEFNSSEFAEAVSMLLTRFGIFSEFDSGNILVIKSPYAQQFADTFNCCKNEYGFRNTNEYQTQNDTLCDEIVSIETFESQPDEKVYDLTIPKTKNFGLANGLQVYDTSETGYIQRKLIKAMEDLKVEYDYTVRNSSGHIIQFIYGEDNIEAVKVESQKYKVIDYNYETFQQTFGFTVDEDWSRFLTPDVVNAICDKKGKITKENFNILREHYEQLLEDRRYFIEYVCRNSPDDSIFSPVNVFRLITNALRMYNYSNKETSLTKTNLNPVDVVKRLNKLEKEMAKINNGINNIMFNMLIRHNLNPASSTRRLRLTKEAFNYIIDQIKFKYADAMVQPSENVGTIAAQSMGEPATQMSVAFNTQILLGQSDSDKTDGPTVIKRTTIGEFIDTLMRKNKDLTYDVPNHTNSKETNVNRMDTNYYVMSVNDKETNSWTKISHVSKHPPNGGMIKVTTQSGRVVTSTLSHNFLKKNMNKVDAVTADQIMVGDRIPVCKVMPRAETHTTENVGTRTFDLTKPESHEFGWFCGFYMSRGQISKTKKSSIEIASGNDQDIKSIQSRINELFGVLVGIKARTTGVAVVTDEMLYTWIVSNFGTKTTKRVPEWLYLAPAQFIGAFLKGFMDASGIFNANKHTIKFMNKHRDVIEDITMLFTTLGMFGSVYTEYPGQKKQMWCSMLPNKFAQKYLDTIGTDITSIRENLTTIADYESSATRVSHSQWFDKVPTIGHMVDSCGKKLEMDKRYKVWGRLESIGIETLAKHYETFKGRAKYLPNVDLSQEFSVIEQAINSEVMWDKIVSIEEYQPQESEFVYDFTIPTNETFMVGNGLFVHNTLNTFHHAGISEKSNVTRGVPRLKELIHINKNPKNPSLTVYLKDGKVDPDDKQVAKQKAKQTLSSMELTTIKDLVLSVRIYYDNDSYNTKIEEDKMMMKMYKILNEIEEDCSEHSNWVLRIEFDKRAMLDKEITMDDVYFCIKENYANLLDCKYTDDNASKLIFRIKVNEVDKKKLESNDDDQMNDINILKNISSTILNKIVIRGINGINKVTMRKVNTFGQLDEYGNFNKNDEWILDTDGINLTDVLSHADVDATRTISNDIYEVYNTLGIEAVRQVLINEIFEVLEHAGSEVNYRHIALLVDTMTSKGILMPINRHGINKNDIGPLAKCSFEETTEKLIDAAIFGEADNVTGVSSNIMMGQVAPCGTGTFDLMLDENAMFKYSQEFADEIEDESSESEAEDSDDDDGYCGDANLDMPNINHNYQQMASDVDTDDELLDSDEDVI
jgi:DNA-directed RNA polymerase beta' subunit